MKKQDLYSGDIVQLRNGEKCIVIKDARFCEKSEDLVISLKNGLSCPLSEYDDDLRFKGGIRAGDIMKVCAYDYTGGNIQKHIINNLDLWTWEKENANTNKNLHKR